MPRSIALVHHLLTLALDSPALVVTAIAIRPAGHTELWIFGIRRAYDRSDDSEGRRNWGAVTTTQMKMGFREDQRNLFFYSFTIMYP